MVCMSSLFVKTGPVTVSAAAITLFVSPYVSHCVDWDVEKHDRQKGPCGISSVISCSPLNKAATVKASLAEWWRSLLALLTG